MEKTIKINIPDGYDDVKFNEKTNEIEFVKKDDEPRNPRSWEEYCEEAKDTSSYSAKLDDPDGWVEEDNRREMPYVCEFNTEEEAKAFIALGKLIQLRDAWIGNWKPEWDNSSKYKYVIYVENNKITKGYNLGASRILSFPSVEMRNDFLEAFRDLIEEAKMLL